MAISKRASRGSKRAKNGESKTHSNGRLTRHHLKENIILGGLNAAHAELVIASGRLIDVELRHPIYEPGGTIKEAYFPTSCMLSVVTRLKDGEMIEIGTVGREGTSGIPLLFGASTTANESFCQVPGEAIKIPATLFSRLHTESLTFRRLLDRYVQSYINLLGQLAACNRLHSVLERCSRWLLMTQDRVMGDDLPLTHEFLAMMLGTRRSGVTIAAATLRTAGFIRYSQGRIKILDREGLESSACECYEVARKQFAGLLRPLS